MRHISQVERIALRDHEAIAEARREYEPDVTRIAAAMLGSYAQNQVVHTVASVFAVLWDQAHRLDPQRAGTAGWICHLARRESLACLRAGLPPGLFNPRRTTIRILTLELSGLPTGSSAELNGILRQLPDADRRLLVRGTGVTRTSMRWLSPPVWIAAYWNPDGGRAYQTDCYMGRFFKSLRPMALSDWDMLDPDLLPTRCRTPRCGSTRSPFHCRTAVHPFPTGNGSRSQRARWPLLVLALVLLVAGFVAGFALHPWKSSPPTAPNVPTGLLNSTPPTSHVAVNLFPLTPSSISIGKHCLRSRWYERMRTGWTHTGCRTNEI